MSNARGIKAGNAYVELGIWDKTKKQWQFYKSQFKQAARGFGVVAAGATAAAIAITKATQAFAEMGDKIAKTSRKLDLTTDQFQKLAYAATLSGVGQEQMLNGISTLNRLTSQAAKNGGEMAKAFEEIGLSAQSLNRMTAHQRLMTVIDTLNQQDFGTRLRIGAKLLGEEFKQLIPLFEGGSEALHDMGKSAEQAGAILSPAQVARAEEMANKFGEFSIKWNTAWAKIGSEFVPLVTRVIDNVLIPAINRLEEAVQQGSDFAEWVLKKNNELRPDNEEGTGIGGGVRRAAIAAAGLQMQRKKNTEEWRKGVKEFVDGFKGGVHELEKLYQSTRIAPEAQQAAKDLNKAFGVFADASGTFAARIENWAGQFRAGLTPGGKAVEMLSQYATLPTGTAAGMGRTSYSATHESGKQMVTWQNIEGTNAEIADTLKRMETAGAMTRTKEK